MKSNRLQPFRAKIACAATSTQVQLADQSVVQAVAQALDGQLYTGLAYRSEP